MKIVEFLRLDIGVGVKVIAKKNGHNFKIGEVVVRTSEFNHNPDGSVDALFIGLHGKWYMQPDECAIIHHE